LTTLKVENTRQHQKPTHTHFASFLIFSLFP
jgi:hypothetical protein